ncbi:heat shock 22 kDa protein, mitochondrial-like isoform X1 [Ananas comosus]|uniref:Heat shock 22 kDa protein, mitochondrial-like isoform X1 n=1 Tax=Ananas comosus TaxID=4615 RepID=A0A6P5F9U0_ANACO|nr:heat shock 22 kDa protein, mitochondrial-like isoform X1 [Ananas comosus]
MASMIVSKRAPVISMLVEKLRASALRPAAASARSFTTDQPSEERSLDIDRRRSDVAAPVRRRGGDLFPSPFFSEDVWDPFNVGTSLSQMMNMMEQMLEVSPSIRLGWDAWEDDKALHLTIEMPGLGREDVKVWMEENTLVIRGESKEEEGSGGGDEGGEAGRGGRRRQRYSTRIELPSKGYKTAEIKAEMKNGVLKVAVPKAAAEERDDVIHVQVQ